MVLSSTILLDVYNILEVNNMETIFLAFVHKRITTVSCKL